ncbi:MAG: hypothetical protein NT150_12410 [Bacteroidetes bacterium]|nr:hypothetical protein [Bacteroidota bacterium]
MTAQKSSGSAPSAQLIDKEQVKLLRFSNTDVLPTKQEQLQRFIDLQRAAAMGATNKSNVKIYFKSYQGNRYKVEATIWAVTEQNITLKGEVLIPIISIYKVGLF